MAWAFVITLDWLNSVLHFGTSNIAPCPMGLVGHQKAIYTYTGKRFSDRNGGDGGGEGIGIVRKWQV